MASPASTGSSNNDHHEAHAHGNGNGNGAASPTNEVKTTYSDPGADVGLKCNEGRVFRVESYVLKAHSAYFRDLFKTAGIPSEPIPIDASIKILKLLLDIMHMKPVPSHFVWACRDRLFKLCDKYALASVGERALLSLHDPSVLEKDPWGIFCLASQRGHASAAGNIALAKSALKALAAAEGKEDHDNNNKVDFKLGALTPSAVQGVAMPYLLGLYNAALGANTASSIATNGSANSHGNDEGVHDGGGGAGPSWKVIAERFSPVVG